MAFFDRTIMNSNGREGWDRLYFKNDTDKFCIAFIDENGVGFTMKTYDFVCIE